MRVMTLIKSSEQLGEPPASFWAEMDKSLPEIDATITMIGTGQLLPSSVAGALVRSSGGRSTVLDGPFTEAKELVGGYSIIEVETFAEAVEAARKFVAIHERSWPGWSGEAEVRQLAD
ncbi:MAG TPA: YciI family protein [Jiangellales bacterium]|nr:YciI family protein [Jiangellales bacterium]